MNNKKIKVGITHGDTNGIGYEVILKMLEDPRIADLCTVVVYGSGKVASFYRKAMELQQVQFNRIDSAAEAKDGVYNIINVVGEDLKVEPGTATEEAGAAALASLEAAVSDLRVGDIDVLVTAPINKHSIQSSSFNFPGHTEYLEVSFDSDETPCKALMIMCADRLRVALLTTHVPLSKVAEAVTKEAVVEKLKQFDRSLRRDFGVQTPRIAVLSLNPHAGEDGLLGMEENEIIIPAIKEARDERILAFGPYASDGFFGSGNYATFDGVLAMYHDQGLVPFKTLSMDSGVNFTAGLPVVRTSPDHGTGYDIACKNEANPESMRCALYTAIDIYRNRINYDEAYSHPLRHHHLEKEKSGKQERDAASAASSASKE
ncbi:MAG: 4-hydroxythreonine-4-phosphate dehydrogenase PdxA [Muribaculaceae bacterium]|nr:4-hydroxythreonine-4-phosphate dehydrogenase PdxA [Muribaculaceae bacterium]